MPNEEDIDKAINDLKSSKCATFTEAADKHNVHRSTLSRRYHKITVSRAENVSLNKKHLTNTMEEALLELINDLTIRGMPPTPQILENLVVELRGAPIGPT
jgi:hypothetical protein